MEAKAYIKNVKISPKKIRFLLDDVKKMDPYKAINHLYYTPNKAAKILYKAIKSAIDNAKNLSKDTVGLKFKTLLIEEGRKLKRFRAGGRGNAKPILKRYSHIKVVLESSEVKSLEKSSSQKEEPVKALKSKGKSKADSKSSLE
ncbi:MAG: 50S ribosomal protein L22 [bacterium]